MVKVKNTGNYKIWRQKVGQIKEDLMEFQSREKAIAEFQSIDKEVGWEYYCDEEVVYKKTHKDEAGNLVDSTPNWRRINL